MQVRRRTSRPSSPIPADWCPNGNTRDDVLASRNVLVALWAGGLMGLSGPALTSYAVEVHLADFDTTGDGDVIDKITADLHRTGLAVRSLEVRLRLSAFHRQALAETQATD
ncbi:ATPase inhibitor subunit zeta [Methylobacterium oryzisoli]